MSEKEERKVNININEGDAFFAHELSINFSPIHFIFDFRCITPRVDPRSRDATVLNLKHNVVMIDVFNAKKTNEMLTKAIERYEKEFGKIERPKAIEAMEKKRKKVAVAKDKGKDIPNYFG